MTNGQKQTLFYTCCGSLTGLCEAILASDILRTCVLGATGTAVSFFVTLWLKRVCRRWK